MANLVITAKASAFKYAPPPALISFRDEDKKQMVAMPELVVVKGKNRVQWTVPDTPANRTMFRQYYKGDLYSCESIDLETPEPFKEEASEEPASTEEPKA